MRNLTRSFLTSSHGADSGPPSAAELADTERAVRTLLAILYATKNHLRSAWDVGALSPLPNQTAVASKPAPSPSSPLLTRPPLRCEYSDLLLLPPPGLPRFESHGLGLPLQLTYPLESHIQRLCRRGRIDGPQASLLTAQVNALVGAYGRMETIKMTPLPVAHLIHQKQVLALFGCVLPFAMVDDMAWWAVPIVTLVAFTLYGIEGIGSQLEDPFGWDRIDIKMDAIVEDMRVEMGVLLGEWRRAVGEGEGRGMFAPAAAAADGGDTVEGVNGV